MVLWLGCWLLDKGVLEKLFEKMLMARLVVEIERSGGLSPFQFGFRKGYSTVGALKRVGLVEEAVESCRLRTEEYCWR